MLQELLMVLIPLFFQSLLLAVEAAVLVLVHQQKELAQTEVLAVEAVVMEAALVREAQVTYLLLLLRKEIMVGAVLLAVHITVAVAVAARALLVLMVQVQEVVMAVLVLALP